MAKIDTTCSIEGPSNTPTRSPRPPLTPPASGNQTQDLTRAQPSRPTPYYALQSHDPQKKVWTEAESNRIGNVHCPPVLWKKLSQSKLIELKLSIAERCVLLREDYPHFCENPTTLTELLNVLVRLRGQDQVSQWLEQIANSDWEAFLQSILVDHYDLSYRKPSDQKSIYSAPLAELTVESASLDSYDKSAEDLVNLNI